MLQIGRRQYIQNISRVGIFNINKTINDELNYQNTPQQIQIQQFQLQQHRQVYQSKGILFDKWVRQGQYFTLDPSLDKFINCIVKKGRKSLAYKILLETCNILQKIYPDQRVGDVIQTAIENVKPIVEVRKVRIAGRTRHVPLAIPKRRQHNMGIRWILKAARDRKWNVQNSFAECLAVELIDAYSDKGTVRRRRAELHRLAEGGRSMIRRRWWKKSLDFSLPDI
eukprot:TRINITY_DN76697_c0_g1_i4.p3 TRINITY_DN76697_c0_g1~~TRINITY_DN76697_c0_g1_i4.p3  ORF type:complete len:225 (-),score=13.20 TRINITY_DN76697_c0_g1_i4:294-968(-)